MADTPLTGKELNDALGKTVLKVQEQNAQNKVEVELSNAQSITQPLIERQEKGDLKRLEKDNEQRSLFEDIANGMNGIADSITENLKGLGDAAKDKGKGILKFLGIALGAAAGVILAPVFAAVAFFKQLAVELRFLNKLSGGRLAKVFAPVLDLFKRIGDFFKKIFKPITSRFASVQKGLKGLTKSTGFLGKFFKFLKIVGSVVGKVFEPLTKGFKTGFGVVTKFAKVAGRVLGKLFLPITILMGIFDFVKGFMKGFKEGGIIEGIKQGIISVVDGLIGMPIRLLSKIPQMIAGFLGLDNLAAGIKEGVDGMLQGIYDAFGGYIDIIKGIFTFDGEMIKQGFTAIWSGIIKVVTGPFKALGGLLKDIFGTQFIDDIKSKFNIGSMIKKMFAQVKLFIANTFDWVPGLGSTLDKMRDSANADLADLEAERLENVALLETKQNQRALEEAQSEKESQTMSAAVANTTTGGTTINQGDTLNVIGGEDTSIEAQQAATRRTGRGRRRYA